MSPEAVFLIVAFTAPQTIRTDPLSMLWLLPLAAAIAVVYKATKLPKITPAVFLKETIVLFGTIVVFMVISALVLYVFAWLFTE